MGDITRTIEPEPPSLARRRSDSDRELSARRYTRITLGELSAGDRPRIEEILRASRVFTSAEIAVALEVVDEGIADCAGALRAGRIAGDVHSQSALPEGRPRNPQSDYLFLGAFTADDGLVGYACWGPTPATDRTWDLYWIAVDPSLHGAGIGTTLLEEVERRLVHQRARMLVAETSSRSEYAATHGFYRRRGYTEAARVRDFYSQGDDRIIFVKRFLTLADGRGADAR